jgi:hypothetical protein
MEINQELQDVPNLELFTLYFYGHGLTPKRRQIHDDHLLTNLQYHRKTPDDHFNNEVDQWAITVQAIPAAIKKEAFSCFRQEGFAKIREWFTIERPPVWYFGYKRLYIYYNESMKQLRYVDC